jgi:hypothetical protein
MRRVPDRHGAHARRPLLVGAPGHPSADARRTRRLLRARGPQRGARPVAPRLGRVVRREPELVGWAWVPAGRLAECCRPYRHRRITSALAALTDPAKRGYRVEGQAV